MDENQRKMKDIKLQIRPQIESIVLTENFNAEEKFQNEVLRPIIKLQRELILRCFEHYLAQHKINLDALSSIQKTELIHNLFKKSARLKTELRGLIIGLFTLEEYIEYLEIPSLLNRRMNNILLQRILSCYEV